MTTGRYFWFLCESCGWNAIRYRNVKKCQECGKPVFRQREATQQEQAAQVAEAVRKHEEWRRDIPE